MHVDWSEAVYGTGVREIDDQHKTLFERVNLLLDACDEDGTEREVELTLQFLSHYTVTHFRFEERWMRDHGCPGGDLNRAAHSGFIDRLDAFRADFRDNGATPELRRAMTTFLSQWLTAHIEKVDIQNLRQPDAPDA